MKSYHKACLIVFFLINVVSSVYSQITINSQEKGIVYLQTQQKVEEAVLPTETFIFKPVETQKIFVTKVLLGNDVKKTVSAEDVLFPGEYAVFEINTNGENLTYIPFAYQLSSQAINAINRAPKWLKMDLTRQFRKLHKLSLDDDYAQLILDANQSIVDEVAFQVANIPYESLIDTRLRNQKSLIVENAQMIYDVVDSLKYVELVEHGTFASGDYYTTTRYRVKNGKTSTDTFWYEIPRDHYYWYVVHPRLYQEGVFEQDNSSSTTQRTWGYFWREFLWYNPDKNHDYTKVNKTTSLGTVSTIPRLGEMMQQPKILWDRDNSGSAFNYFTRTPQPNDNALTRLGWWASHCVPVDPDNNNIRPIQPDQIAYEHDGRCGEDTYLLSAACRTSLIPVTYMGTMGEDHVWCGLMDNNEIYHFEFFRGGLMNSGWGFTSMMEGGGPYEKLSSTWIISHIMTYRPDGAIGQATANYTNVCTMKVKVADKNGNPVDGAKVILYCKPGPYSSNWQKAGYWFTDHTGEFSMPLGDKKQYGFQISHPTFGIQPSSTTFWPVLTTNAVAGQTYNASLQFSDKSMPESHINTSSFVPASGSYGVHLDFTSAEIIAGKHDDDYQKCQFAKREINSGSIGFFICDEANYTKYKTGQKADVYESIPYFGAGNIYLPLPAPGKWYVVISNEHSTVNYQEFTAKCELVSNAVKVGKEEQNFITEKLMVYPNPVNNNCRIEVPSSVSEVEICDLFGKRIDVLNNQPFIWKPLNDLKNGVYIIRANTPEKVLIERVMLIR